ncbi:hypothetical protein GGI21_006496, partial [Coemansia aciculifera]
MALTFEVPVFDGDTNANFADWLRDVSIAAGTLGVEYIILSDTRTSSAEGQVPAFSDADKIADAKARGIILSALSPGLKATVNNRTAFEAITALKTSFASSKTAKLVNDLSHLLNFKMADGDIGGRQFTVQWQILCAKIDMAQLTVEDVMKLVYLASLNGKFESIAIEYGDKKPADFTIQQVQTKVFNCSDMFLAATSGAAMVMAASSTTTMAATASANADNKQSATVVYCVYCKKRGHVVADCRKLKAKQEKAGESGGSDASSEGKTFKLKLASTSIYAAHAAVNWLADKDTWLLDSGANASSCNKRSAFTKVVPEGGDITTVSG